MEHGTIKKKTEKGFGFIAMENSPDLFFHLSACNGAFDSLAEGQAVTFDLEDSPKGKRAINVQAA
ncbi:MAG: cold shock domain-containing protein [Candidatus Peribacteraceae bacterium]